MLSSLDDACDFLAGDDRGRAARAMGSALELDLKVANPEQTLRRSLEKAVLDAARQLGPQAAVVIGCDFIDIPDSPVHAAMLNEGAVACAYTAAHGGDDANWLTWKVRSSGEIRRSIDYLLFRPGVVEPVGVLDYPFAHAVESGRRPSGWYPGHHLGPLAVFERKPGSKSGGRKKSCPPPTPDR